MRVQCKLCEHENNGFCEKKKNHGVPIRVKTNKRRICSSYDEDPLRVLSLFRTREKHLRNVQAVNRRIQLAKTAAAKLSEER